MGEAVRTRIEELSAMKKLPKGFNKARLEEAKAGLAAFNQAWSDAAAAAQSGDVTSAIEKGRAAHVRALGLASDLGLPPAAAATASTQAPATR
jgi:hypothetical protein